MLERAKQSVSQKKLEEVPQEYRIIACIGSRNASPEEYSQHWHDFSKNGENIDWEASEQQIKDREIKNPEHMSAGFGTYVISGINEHDKYSERYKNCTGGIFVGKDKHAGRTISFVTHEWPRSYINKNRESFQRDLSERLTEFAHQTVEGTIDAVIVGGKLGLVPSKTHLLLTTHTGDYKRGVEALAKLIREILHVEPRVVGGPTDYMGGGSVSVFLDTQNRRLFLYKYEQDKLSKTYDVDASDLRNQMRKTRRSQI